MIDEQKVDANLDLPAKLDRLAVEGLGIYVYVLIDPIDNRIFYVGKGKGSRVLHHFHSQQKTEDNNKIATAKRKQIAKIRENGQEPFWHVVAHRLVDEKTAFNVESSLIYALQVCEKSMKLVNQNRGMYITSHGGMSAEVVIRRQASLVNPSASYPCVILFNIANEFKKSNEVYASTRQAWKHMNRELQNRSNAIAVGLDQGISRGVFQIDPGSWIEMGDQRWGFSGKEIFNSELNEKRWSSVINLCKGRWLRGGYLAVEFDGRDSVRFLIGHQDKNTWYDLLPVQ